MPVQANPRSAWSPLGTLATSLPDEPLTAGTAAAT